MADVAAIRAGLAANLAVIEDLQISPYFLSNPTPPTAVIFSDETDFDQALQRGMDTLNMIVRVLVAAGTDQGSQANLDEYRDGSGPRSVKEAIEADKTLGGACDDLRVESVSRDTPYMLDQAPALGCEFRVHIIV